jgi:MinD-like ATPase involved in chromosome partitioning or flagellar assembly
MKADKRIIPISSGKGGVGKTMFAINYALELSKHARTVLVDLDLNTSSVRASIDTPVPYDLYHFFTRNRPLQDCVTQLSTSLDPLGRFRNFGFVAAPRHLIDGITNLRRERREKLIDAINALDATYVVLDMKAGLDSNVIEFLPYSNSGILVFTPHLPAATLAASDVVKAILFRKLRAIFSKSSAIYQVVRGVTHREARELLDVAEDTYDDRVKNLDDFAVRLHEKLGDHPVVQMVSNTIHFFRVHYVLNMFNGVQDSYETAVKPFTENLVENVSAHLTMVNLGWVVSHPDVNKAAQRRVPLLLGDERPSEVNAEIGKLAAEFLSPKAKAMFAPHHRTADPGRYLESQLQVLNKMHADMKGASYRENFKYIAARTLHVMSSRRLSDFGDNQIFKKEEFQRVLAQRGR